MRNTYIKFIIAPFLALLPFSAFAKNELSSQQQQWLQKRDLCFTENKGQISDQDGNARPDIQYKIRASKGLSIFIGNGQLYYQFAKPQTTPPVNHDLLADECHESEPVLFDMYRLDVTLEGSNKQAEVVADEKQQYYEHYHTARLNDKNAPINSFARITYKEIYPNIDWVLYIKDNRLEYDFVIRPGGNAKDIRIRYNGATELHESDDAITITTPFGNITEGRLFSYKKEDGKKIAAKFELDKNTISFNLGHYNETIVIDPTLIWSTYFGGLEQEMGQGIICDEANDVYIGGVTLSASNIATSGSHQSTFGGAQDAFLAKFSKNGTLRWATYYGGAGLEAVYGLAADMRGNIFATGSTTSMDSIATAGAYHTTYGGGTDAFLAKFDSTGILRWATYFGGSSSEIGNAVSCDDHNGVYFAGSATSFTGLATTGAYQATLGGGNDGFLAKFDSSGALNWSTYFGGSANDVARDVTFGSGNVYLAGITQSTDHIATTGAHQTFGGGSFQDAFLAQFGSDGTLHWATYYGGSGSDQGYCVASYGNNVYLAGCTSSADSIATAGSYQGAIAGPFDACLAKFNNLGVLQWSTYYGGGSQDWAIDMSCDTGGNICLTGETMSNDSIATADGYRTAHITGIDAFVVKFSSSGSRLWGTYFGGSGPDWGLGIACDHLSNIYITGDTRSLDSIATLGAHDTAIGGWGDAFLSKFGDPVIEAVTDNVPEIITDVWPNPAKDHVYFRSHATLSQGSIIITDITGKYVTSLKMDPDNTAKVNIANLPAGIYLYHIYSDGQRIKTGKFVKE
jgi:hypothetical protein